MFTTKDRERVRDYLLTRAQADPAIVATAVVGSFAQGADDRSSDLDLTFAVADGKAVDEVLEAWTSGLSRDFEAIQLFDWPVTPTIYRVFLLPGGLQVDLSFTAASQFRPRGPAFKLLFGAAGDAEPMPTPSPEHLFGMGVHHAVRARVCIERGHNWEAELWISHMRELGLSLASLRRGLNPSYGRDFDHLPADVLEHFAGALVDVVQRASLERALSAAVHGLLRESAQVGELATRAEPELLELIS